MRRWWISWWGTKAFELTSPWWATGKREDGAEAFCAAVIAMDADSARRVISNAHGPVTTNQDPLPNARLKWRFCEPRGEAWHPFTERFPQADWMKWPGRSS